MLNPFKEVNWNPGLTERRTFAWSLIIGFPVIAVVFTAVVWVQGHSWKPALLWVGVIGFALGLVLRLRPQIARPFYVVWYLIACCMGIIVGNLLLILVFYLVLTPLGLLRRTVGREPFSKGFDRSKGTYWKPAKRVVDLRQYYRQF